MNDDQYRVQKSHIGLIIIFDIQEKVSLNIDLQALKWDLD